MSRFSVGKRTEISCKARSCPSLAACERAPRRLHEVRESDFRQWRNRRNTPYPRLASGHRFTACSRTHIPKLRFGVGSYAERVTKNKGHSQGVSFVFGDPYGNRTHVFAVRGRCLNRLTNGPLSFGKVEYTTTKTKKQEVFEKKFLRFTENISGGIFPRQFSCAT